MNDYLMTQFTVSYEVEPGLGLYTTVTRLSNGQSKTFFQAGHYDWSQVDRLMRSITDELAEGYFPRPRKK